MDVSVRHATAADLAAMLDIYNDVIARTTAVYTEESVSVTDYLSRYEARQAKGYPTLVATQESNIIGFASFDDFRAWPCYRYSVEHSVHVAEGFRRQGVGHKLLSAIHEAAALTGKHALIGGIDAQNAASRRLHANHGFTEVGCMREVGRKFDRWLDLIFVQKLLRS